MSAPKHPNKSQSWADNVATARLTERIVILEALVNVMTEVSRRREALLEHYKSLLRGFVVEVTRR